LGNDLLTLLFIFIGAFIFIWLAAKGDNKNEAVLNYWIDKNKFELLERRHPYLWELSFWKHCKPQAVYIIKINDSQGVMKTGRVIFGSCWAGVLGSLENIDTKVIWDK